MQTPVVPCLQSLPEEAKKCVCDFLFFTCWSTLFNGSIVFILYPFVWSAPPPFFANSLYEHCATYAGTANVLVNNSAIYECHVYYIIKHMDQPTSASSFILVASGHLVNYIDSHPSFVVKKCCFVVVFRLFSDVMATFECNELRMFTDFDFLHWYLLIVTVATGASANLTMVV